MVSAPEPEPEALAPSWSERLDEMQRGWVDWSPAERQAELREWSSVYDARRELGELERQRRLAMLDDTVVLWQCFARTGWHGHVWLGYSVPVSRQTESWWHLQLLSNITGLIRIGGMVMVMQDGGAVWEVRGTAKRRRARRVVATGWSSWYWWY